MLQDIYHEYSEEIFDYIFRKVHGEMTGKQLIEILVRSYYNYIQDHREIFNFVEQFSSCPSLASGCTEIKGICNINNFIGDLKKNNIIKDYRIENLKAMIFYPVKSIAFNECKSEKERVELLEEMIGIIQDALLK